VTVNLLIERFEMPVYYYYYSNGQDHQLGGQTLSTQPVFSGSSWLAKVHCKRGAHHPPYQL